MPVTATFRFEVNTEALNKRGKKLYGYQVLEIKELAPFETEAALGKRYGVHGTMINHIKRGRCWKHLFI